MEGSGFDRDGSLTIRHWHAGDIDAVVDLVRSARRLATDEEHVSFFRWKHFENPFGPSPGWLAIDDGRPVGFRTFVRWELERAGDRVSAVRAVDTSVHPQWQRRGIFSSLTRQAMAELSDMGVQLIFNTPNSKSLQGYLKLGWEVVGRLPVVVRVRSLPALARVARSRAPAERWSLPGAGGSPAPEVLADADGLNRLLASQPPDARLRTRRSSSYLGWRYGLDALHYRAVLAGRSVDDGVAVFRLRRRARTVEAAICEVIAPGGDREATRRLAVQAAKASGADHAIRLGGAVDPRHGFLPLPGQGPVLACRLLPDGHAPAVSAWKLSLGDVELL